MKIVTLTGYPFVNHVEQKIVMCDFNLSNILDSQGYHCNQANLMRHGTIRLMGYMYDAREHLKHYVIKTSNGDLSEIYALNKTNARALMHCKVDYILEVKKIN